MWHQDVRVGIELQGLVVSTQKHLQCMWHQAVRVGI